MEGWLSLEAHSTKRGRNECRRVGDWSMCGRKKHGWIITPWMEVQRHPRLARQRNGEYAQLERSKVDRSRLRPPHAGPGGVDHKPCWHTPNRPPAAVLSLHSVKPFALHTKSVLPLLTWDPRVPSVVVVGYLALWSMPATLRWFVLCSSLLSSNWKNTLFPGGAMPRTRHTCKTMDASAETLVYWLLEVIDCSGYKDTELRST